MEAEIHLTPEHHHCMIDLITIWYVHPYLKLKKKLEHVTLLMHFIVISVFLGLRNAFSPPYTNGLNFTPYNNLKDIF